MIKTFSGFNNKIEKIRAQISDLIEEQSWLENSPVPVNEVADSVNKAINYQAEQFESDLNLSDFQIPSESYYHSDIFKTSGKISGESVNGVLIGFSETDLGPMLCFLFKDEIKRKLSKLINEMNYESGPPLHERPGILRDIEKQLFELGKAEEALIVEAEDNSFEFVRREDCDPKVVLEVSVD